jgi:signal transduction histidine kinase
LRTACERVLAASEHQEALIEALLTLARSQRGLVAREPLDLGPITAAVVGEAPATVESELSPAPTTGDPALVQRLVANLVDNAVRYNGAEGWVRAWTGVRDGRPTLEVSNTGPVIAQQDVEGLVEPFRRLAGGERSAERGGGLGLGLSIVDAIAAAHGARLTATPRAAGGLTVEVSFP